MQLTTEYVPNGCGRRGNSVQPSDVPMIRNQQLEFLRGLAVIESLKKLVELLKALLADLVFLHDQRERSDDQAHSIFETRNCAVAIESGA